MLRGGSNSNAPIRVCFDGYPHAPDVWVGGDRIRSKRLSLYKGGMPTKSKEPIRQQMSQPASSSDGNNVGGINVEQLAQIAATEFVRLVEDNRFDMFEACKLVTDGHRHHFTLDPNGWDEFTRFFQVSAKEASKVFDSNNKRI